MGVYEGEKEVLAVADYKCAALARNSDCADARVGRGAFCIYVVLG